MVPEIRTDISVYAKGGVMKKYQCSSISQRWAYWFVKKNLTCDDEEYGNIFGYKL